MKTDTLKLKLNNFVYDLIDKVFPKGDIISSIGNATAKFYIDQNMYKLDTYFKPFEDVNGEIDTQRFLSLLEENVFSSGVFKLNISKYLPKEVNRFIPCDIVIDKDDIINILTKEEVGCKKGTTMIVKNLFFNTPVRYKFLKKDFTETGYIEDVITRIALDKPDISIKLITTGKTVIQTT